MNWTPSQADAINYRGNKNALVAAAAGSGKTAVLVERIISRILDKDDPVSIDRILVLTFTNAAAKEMKAKIASAIDKRLADDPKNKHLRTQTYKIGAADISTVHAFAQKMIKNNIHMTDIPADFSLADDAENETILENALTDVLERYYARLDKLPSFAQLTFGYGGVKNDKALRGIILDIYRYSRSLAQPSKWLRQSADVYKTAAREKTVKNTPLADMLLDIGTKRAKDILSCYDEIMSIASQNFCEGHKVTDFYTREREMIENIANAKNIDEYFEAKNNLSFGRRPSLRGADGKDPILKDAIGRINAIRDLAKKAYTSPLDAYKSAKDAAYTMEKLYPAMRTLKNIILMLMRRHNRLKLQNGLLDFADLEHTLIRLLMKSDGSPTEFCKTLSDRYSEIYVDEYQDTNNIQDTMFRLISGGKGNIFMVGDLKQSIYGFRNATPELFLEKYFAYDKDGKGEGKLFVLSDNFRSRDTVINSVNELFGKIMFRSSAGIDYTEDESLHCGAEYPDPVPNNDDNDNDKNKNIYATELIMTDVLEDNTTENVDTRSIEIAETKTEKEARTIAERIIKLIEIERLPVFDRSLSSLRPIEFSDIAVLFRSAKNNVPVYSRIFREYGIPVLAESGGFLDALEIRIVTAFLSIIDDPMQDIPLVAVMKSPIFGFVPDELAEIRAGSRNGCYYDAVRTAAETNKKARNFIDTLDRLRDCSSFMGVHEMIYKICYDLDYISVAEGMNGGSVRRANLLRLLDIAGSFEKTKHSGMFGFVKYLQNTAKKADMRQAKNGSAENAVTLTTIHKSKGLEYPVVILADNAHSTRSSASVLYSEKCGFALDYVDTEKKIKYPSFPMDLLGEAVRISETAEEMRLLYVAMTRAKEKLILSCTNARAQSSAMWRKPVTDSKGNIMRLCISEAKCFRDQIVFGFLANNNMAELRGLIETDISDLAADENSSAMKFFYVTPEHQNEEDENNKGEINEYTPEDASDDMIDMIDTNHIPTREELSRLYGYEYDNIKLTELPLKLSVSELKRNAESISETEWEYTPRLDSIADRTFSSVQKNNAAEIGTITHFMLQHIDPADTLRRDRISAQLDDFVMRGILTEDQLALADRELICRFFESEVGAAVRDAAEGDRLLREYKLLFPVKAKLIYPQLRGSNAGEADIIVQGIADCIILSGTNAILIDYKTDNCTSETAAAHAEKYRIQADYYTIGIKSVLGLDVTKRIIYFLKPGVAVEL